MSRFLLAASVPALLLACGCRQAHICPEPPQPPRTLTAAEICHAAARPPLAHIVACPESTTLEISALGKQGQPRREFQVAHVYGCEDDAGRLQGSHVGVYGNGRVAFAGTNKDGEAVGILRWWDSGGQLLFVHDYGDGSTAHATDCYAFDFRDQL